MILWLIMFLQIMVGYKLNGALLDNGGQFIDFVMSNIILTLLFAGVYAVYFLLRRARG